MKLVFLTSYIPPMVDGVGDYTWHLSHFLASTGHEVYIICRVSGEVTYRYTNKVHILAHVADWNYQGTRRMVQTIKEISPDWILLQYVPYSFHKKGCPLFLVSLLAECKPLTKYSLVFFHEVRVRKNLVNPPVFITSLLQKFIARKICNWADKIVTSINFYGKILNGITSKDINVIPIGTNIIPYPIADETIATIRKKIAPNGEKIICTFGIRDHDILIKVFSELKNDRQFKLLIIGPVKNKDIYRKQGIEAFVTGYLEEKDVFSYLKASDIFFLPDGLDKKGQGGTSNKSTSLAAALAANLPVIGIKGDMNNDLLLNTPDIYLWDTCNVQDVIRYIKSRATKVRKAKNFIFFDEQLSWNEIVRRYLILLQEST